VEGIRQAKLTLAKHLIDIPPFDPAHPDSLADFDIPAEPVGKVERPLGH
jgi:hypothetical protein